MASDPRTRNRLTLLALCWNCIDVIRSGPYDLFTQVKLNCDELGLCPEMTTDIQDSFPATEALQIIRSAGTMRERGWLPRLGRVARLIAALLITLVVPQLTAKIAVNFLPWVATVDPENAFAWLSIHHLTQIVLTLVLMVFWSRGSLKAWGFNLNEARVSLRWFGWFALFCTLGMLVFGILPMLYSHKLPQPNFALNGRNVAGSLGFYYLISGSGEEPLCRGFIMTMLLICWNREFRLGKVAMPVAGLWATLLFMLAHVNYTIFPFKITQFIWQQQLFCLGLGLYYAAAFYRTGSLLCPILAHGFSNGIVWSLIYATIALTPVKPVAQQILGRVALQPNPPIANQEVQVSYEARGGPLTGASQVNLHYGFNGWQQATDEPMTKLSEERWILKLNLPANARQLDLVFTDGTRWDNNKKLDWHLPARATPPGAAKGEGRPAAPTPSLSP